MSGALEFGVKPFFSGVTTSSLPPGMGDGMIERSAHLVLPSPLYSGERAGVRGEF